MTYLRIRSFGRLLAMLTPRTRAARMRQVQTLLDLQPGQRLIDLGGSTELWRYVDVPLDITVLNLPGYDTRPDDRGIHRFTFVTGDATDTGLADDSFDVVFSNSVIEHVGGPHAEAAFAREVRRLAPTYYVQTPSILFPLEAHTGLPLWWLYPAVVKRALYRRWARILPEWGEMVRGTTVIRSATFRRYFPDATIGVERVFGIPKSYFGYRVARRGP